MSEDNAGVESGFVYVLTNVLMPGLVKIGATDDVEARVADISAATGVPAPFDVYATFPTKYPFALEAEVRAGLAPFRTNRRREFYTIPAEAAAAYIEGVLVERRIVRCEPGARQVAITTAAQIGAAITAKRMAMGFSQAALATRASTGRRCVYEIEAGKATAQIGVVLKLMAALDLHPAVVIPDDVETHLSAVVKQLNAGVTASQRVIPVGSLSSACMWPI